MTAVVATTAYLLYYLNDGEKVPFYCGEAIDPARRFKQHQRDAANPMTEKEAYRFLRDHSIREFFYEVVPNTTEADLVTELTLAGFRMFNANRGIRSSAKKRKTLSVFSVINRQADETLERRERRNILHSPAQQLTKSEIVATRIRGEFPTVEQLSSCEWRACPPEMLGVDVARTAERGEYTKIGDVSIYLAMRKKKDITAVARHRDGRVCGLPSSLWWSCPREKLLNVLALEMASPYGWVRPFEKS